VVTREEFEELINEINPHMTKRERRELAENYGHMLTMSHEALREGLDKDPGVQALMRYVRTTALGGAAYKKVYRESAEAPQAAVEHYYQDHRGDFERFNFQRIFIPREKQGQATSLEQASEPTPSTETEMKELAEKAYARAAAGEEFVAVQKDVAKAAGINHEVNVTLDDMVRGALPKEHDAVFELAPGAVSKLISEGSGYYIYKLVSKQTPTLESIGPQVQLAMQNEKLGKSVGRIQDRSKVNADYFDKYDPPAPDPNEPEVDND
jgi:hypothetical protein